MYSPSELPQGWNQCVLGDLIETVSSGVSVNSEDRSCTKGELGVLKTSCVYSGVFRASENKAVLPEETKRVRTYARADHIIVSRMNTPELVGASGYVEETHPTIFLPDRLWQLRTKSSADARWLAFVLGSSKYRVLLRAIATGTSQSMKNISQEAFLRLPVTTPLVSEQRRIAQVLRTWDYAIEILSKLARAKEKYIRGTLAESVSDARSLHKRHDWIRTTIGEVTKLVSRRAVWNEQAVYRLITVKRACGGLVFRGDRKGHEILTKDMYTVRANDFVISKRQVVHGAWAMAGTEFDGTHVSKEYACLEAMPDKLWMPYFDWLSRTERLQYEAFICSYGVDIEKMVLNVDWLLQTPILLPRSVDAQKALAGALDCLQDEVRLLRNQLEALRRQKRGLVQKLLSGEWRVAHGNGDMGVATLRVTEEAAQ